MANLNDAAGKDVLRRHAGSFILVAGDTPQRVVHVLELREELDESLEVFGLGKQTDGNVMRYVIHSVNEGNLFLIALHSDVFSIHNQRATKALPITVPGSNVIVVRQRFQLSDELPVRSPNAFLLAMGECTDARSLEVQGEHWFRWTTVIDVEVARAVVAEVAIDASPCSFFPRSQALAEVASEMASLSAFFGVNMFKDWKWLEHTEIYQKVAPKMERSPIQTNECFEATANCRKYRLRDISVE